MLRKKLCKMLAALMVSTIVLGNSVQAVGATVVETIASEGENQGNVLADGTYKITNKTLQKGTDNNSAIRNYIDTNSIVTVKDGKITVTMKYNENGLETVKSTNSITVDGQEIEFKNNEDGSISFEISSIDTLYTRVKINLTYYNAMIPEFIAPGGMHAVDVDLLHEGELVKDSSNDSGSDNENQDNVLANGIYKIANKALKVGTDSESAIRNYIDANSIVTVKDGKITVTMKYNEAGLKTVQSTNEIIVDGEKVNLTKNEDGSISFDIESIDVLYTRINVNLTYHDENLPEFIFPGKIHTVDIELLHEGELTEYKEDDSSQDSGNNGETNKPGDENNGGNTGNEGSNNGGSNNNGSNNGGSNSGVTEEQGAKVYTGKNNVTHDSETGLSMARKALEEALKVEDVNGKKYVTLTFTPMGSTMMNNHTVYVNGAKVEATKSVNGEIVSLRFAVGSLEDSIKVSAYVTMMGSNVEFGVDILEDTLTLVTDGTTNNGGTTGGVTGGTTSGSTTGSTTNGTSGNTTTTEETKITKGKLYSIQNSVTHESETGRTMARKYLNSTSKVEEIDGKYYVTLTFTGAEFMQNHEIYVNGKKVTVTKSTSGDTTNVRFAVSSLSDSIKVKTYVVPMSREVEFGVTLLKDTLTFIKEYTVDTLPETGAPIGSGAVAGLGMLLTSAGVVLAKKRK
ncbi:NEAT domain-containing protein [Clostridium sp. D43t1_170807_H7]|uniref:NEAT domain-containing protein n=1 Tax=Clostridium sp. D43t1_170807_H7 TaxID=2787140 RepID=UPI00189A4108|nr:NEAT domain-containing protein [Clostridium sp. D43t1_170807_H7]